MRESMGLVKFNERNLSDRLQRFVDEKIRHWMKTHDLSEMPADYEVAFYDEDILGEVSCLIVIQSGPKMWRSWETAPNPRLAFSRSLEHLHTDVKH